MKQLFIVRGLPGSGKTTLAESIADAVCSADDYFLNADGEYIFDGSKLKQAHSACQQATVNAMKAGVPKIAVANTFTREWEFKEYIAMAAIYGYQVFTIVVENRHGGVNIHSVPDEKIAQMKNRFEVKL